MRSLPRLTMLLLLIFVALPALIPFASLRAQDNVVTVTLAVPNLTGSVFSDRLIANFESSHPGIKVGLVTVDSRIPAAALDVDKHFQAVQQYASAADVLFVTNASLLGTDTTSISVEATRAGYFLDLKPFTDIDTALNPDDFFPSIGASYQWDGGVWAMPFAADPNILTYSQSAFDSAGLAYPDDKWTLDDFSNAVQKLSLKDASGKVTDPGLDVYGAQYGYMLRALLSASLLDTTAIPNTPKFDTPEVETLFKTWLKLDQDGMIGAGYNQAPLSVSPAIGIVLRPSGADKRGVTLLPGGKATLNVQGFAVSGGTQHPKEAYTLAEWLTTRGDIANNSLATMPARQSLLGKGGTDIVPFTLNITPDLQAVITRAIANALPLSEMRYVDYLASAYSSVKTNNIDIRTALQTAEAQALKNQQAAADRKDKLALSVVTPIPSNVHPAGKITLKVGVVGYSIPNQNEWNKLISDFTADDPDVEKVTLERSLDANSLNQIGPPLLKYDCVYAPFNGVSPSQVTRMLNIDPFLAADPTFDKADIIGGALAQVTLDNKIWMLPSDISPNVLKYDSDRFQKDGVAAPGPSWTIGQFVDALKAFKADGTGQPGFSPVNTFGAYMFQLIAAYGGNPIDYRTNPPTINFTDPATVDAIQQVVNLAKDGAFKYRPLFSTRMDISFQPDKSTIRQATLTAFTLPLPGGIDNANTRVTLYPKGSKYNAVTYNIGGFYISKTAQNPEACYRFISKASRLPMLFSAMPARRSLLADPTLAATQSADTIALYKQIAAALDDPSTLLFPGISVGIDRADVQIQLELYEAFDKVMLLNVDINTALKDAEFSAKAFEACETSLPPLDVGVDQQRAYINGFIDCAIKADPGMTPLYAGLKIK
ncbi:MAG TPA: extracellular solute-binding protein [Aggregatilineales bacterium]|nr:extracellular solute-binding protein [Aggregatilineales bacterium]